MNIRSLFLEIKLDEFGFYKKEQKFKTFTYNEIDENDKFISELIINISSPNSKCRAPFGSFFENK